MENVRESFSLKSLLLLGLYIVPAVAQQQITPPAPIQVNSPIITINSSAGDQTDAHVSKDLAAYTDLAGSTIRYYQFSTGSDTAIPLGTGVSDTLSDVSGNRMCFTRQTPAGDFQMSVFDITTSTIMDVDPRPGALRGGCAISGNTLVYVDFGTGTGSGDIVFSDLAVNSPTAPQPLSLDPNVDQNPNVSPDGNLVVWENCPNPSNCDVWKSVRSAGVWTTSIVVNSSFNEENPDTDGTWIIYDNDQGTATSRDIYFVSVEGGPTTQLAIPGVQVNPSISNGFIGFESTPPSFVAPDIYVYDIAQNLLYQVTSTTFFAEQLNDISVLDNGDVRVVWSANDGPNGELNVYGATFTPIQKSTYNICTLYDQNVAKKAGSAYPIKVQLCDASGNNLSSSSIAVHAVSVTMVNTNTPAMLDETGNANPDFDFRYDATINGYVFNLSTRGYATGTYSLNFTAGTNPTQHSAQFAVK